MCSSATTTTTTTRPTISTKEMIQNSAETNETSKRFAVRTKTTTSPNSNGPNSSDEEASERIKSIELRLPLAIDSTSSLIRNKSELLGVKRIETCDLSNLNAANKNQRKGHRKGSLALLFAICSIVIASITTSEAYLMSNRANQTTTASDQSGELSQSAQVNERQQQVLGAHLQPSFVYVARNKSANFTHLLVDELTNSVYVGATNLLLQLSASNLRAEFALKTGPALEDSRDCAPGDCVAQLAHLDTNALSFQHLQGPDLSLPVRLNQRQTMHTSSSGRGAASGPAPPPPLTVTGPAAARSNTGATIHYNNYNKLLAIEPETRQLIVCGSLNQGACRRHQLGHLANFSDLIPLPVAPNDEHSSTAALVVSGPQGAGYAPSGSNVPKQQQQQQQQRSILYVAASNSRLGPYREMVPAISARHLEPASRAMQIIERSFTDSARVDISFELRDYYLVNYTYAFQHNEYVYFATVQRKSPLRQLEEWGYISRLARLCLNDLSFQSYAEITIECRGNKPSSNSNSNNNNNNNAGNSDNQHQINYNLLQDAQLTSASSTLAHQLGIKSHSAVLVGAFALSKDHTARSQQKSAVCLYPLEKIEQKFNENIHTCYNGSSKARNMNYIAGSVNDCPKAGKAGNIANFCHEPLKLNGSLPLTAAPVIQYDDELLTSIAATQAATSPVSAQVELQPNNKQQPIGAARASAANQRQHQVLVAGTGSGALKRIALLPGERGFGLRGLEFDSVQLDERAQEPVLADLHLLPGQLSAGESGAVQFAVAATPHRVAKVRINACRAPGRAAQSSARTGANQTAADQCNQCAQLEDPYCGWCATTSSCLGRDECLQQAAKLASAGTGKMSLSWQPFDQIRCNDYQPIVPRFVALQASHLAGEQAQAFVDVNIRLNQQAFKIGSASSALALQLAQAHFSCHFDYAALANSNTSSLLQTTISGATTKATQARLNLHTSTVVVGCPLPPVSQRPPQALQSDQLRTRLTVRLAAGSSQAEASAAIHLAGLLNFGLWPANSTNAVHLAEHDHSRLQQAVERELTFYDCSVHSTCRSCLSAGSTSTRRHFACAWCPLSNRCTFNASHPELGCAASALLQATGAPSSQLRASHLAASLDSAQASLLGASIERLGQCGAEFIGADSTRAAAKAATDSPTPASSPATSQTTAPVSLGEVLIPNESRRSIQVALSRPIGNQNRRVKLECLVEIEGAKARLPAKLVELGGQPNAVVACQESAFSYQEELATQRGQLTVILNDNQVVESTDVLMYKCHLFGASPPQLSGPQASGVWRAQELFQAGLFRRQLAFGGARQADCSQCLNVDRKFQCAWCHNQCRQAEQCSELAASTCPPPRIDSIHPTSGPLEGGTLLTIQGSNLGSNEREIQDKITVGGEPCQLVMYSVSTRIVCKTGHSPHGPQAATVFVGNRAGITSAYEKFHYKAVHLTDVTPRIGPASGGTRLYLSGSNFNIGSRIQIFLDDIPCPLDSNDRSSHQIVCVTAPNLFAGSTRITKLTLMIDNSTHYLPYPFTYQPDPIITSIEPAESFLSGGRLVVISGHHLASPQSTKLMVYHEHKHTIVNGTTCMTQNDTVITCLTPAISRDMLAQLAPSTQGGFNSIEQTDQQQATIWNQDNGGLRLKMSLFMDDVKSVRNLDEYYHHLPHFITYYEDPQLFRLSNPVVEFSEELVMAGENLKMRQLDRDMLITIGSSICAIKSISANQVVCTPPVRVAPVFDESGRLIERPLLPIVALIGSNLVYQIGHMQYNSHQYQFVEQAPNLYSKTTNSLANQLSGGSVAGSSSSDNDLTATSISSPSVAILMSLSILGFAVGFAATFMFALSRFRHSKAEREYKRIQLQMGSLDANGQPINGNLFDNIHLNNNNLNRATAQSARSRALEYVGGALSGKKLFYQLNQQLPSFPPSPLTDISSLTGSNPVAAHNQHLVKLSSNGNIINTTAQNDTYHHYNTANSNSSQSSPGSTRNSGHQLFANQNTFAPNVSAGCNLNLNHHLQQQQQQQQALLNQSMSDKSNLLNGHHHQNHNQQPDGNSRNFNWTQEAPSTIVPYAVIEACNLTLKGKKAIKEYV